MTTYDSTTGEVVQNDEMGLITLEQEVALGGFASFVSMYGSGARNILTNKLFDLGLEPAAADAMLTRYKSGPVDKLDLHINEVLTITGAIIDYHDPYKAKPVNGISVDSDGFFYMRLCTTIMKEVKVPVGSRNLKFKRPLLIQVSAREVVKYFLTKMETDRWFDFSAPIMCIFTGTQSTGYSVSTFSEDEAATILAIIEEESAQSED